MYLHIAENITSSVLDALLPVLNEMKDDVNRLNGVVGDLSGNVAELETQTKLELVNLQKTVNKSISSYAEELNLKLDSVQVYMEQNNPQVPSHEELMVSIVSVNTSLANHVSCIKEELNGLNDSVNGLISEFEKFFWSDTKE